MEAHKLQTLVGIKNRLVKSANNVDTEAELIIDALKALDDIDVNKYLINKSGLGNTLNDLRRGSCANNTTIKNMITGTLKRWREIALAEQQTAAAGAPTATATSSAPPPVTKPVAKPVVPQPTEQKQVVALSPEDTALVQENQRRRMMLSTDRRAIVQAISKTFQKFVQDPVKPDQVALGIEEELNKLFHHDKARQQYTDKAKSLTFNITKNEDLRNMLIEGSMPFHRLVNLTPAELASKELKQEREKITQEVQLARRSDQEEIYRKEIQASLGIDPSELWTYDNGDDSNSEPDVEAND